MFHNFLFIPSSLKYQSLTTLYLFRKKFYGSRSIVIIYSLNKISIFYQLLTIYFQVYQVYQNGRKYLSIENVLEWSCYLSALVFVADLTECSAQTGIRQV